mmetsp:Transcript_53594/g.126049  ORF Transcript_53594/g.126049 Transcript_53594/m.126049 type:complete len:119 (+) Transcript_53594:356-712(+)
MKAHKGSAGVQEHGCAVLRVLTFPDKNKVVIAKAGGIEAVVGAMAAHKGSVGVQEQCCALLGSLGVLGVSRGRWLTEGCDWGFGFWPGGRVHEGHHSTQLRTRRRSWRRAGSRQWWER